MSRQPVINTAAFKSTLQTAVYVLGFLGANDAADWVNGHTATLVAIGIGVVNFGGDILAAVLAAQKVTPLASPQTSDGVALAPVTELEKALPPIVDVPVTPDVDPNEPVHVEHMDD